MNPSDFLEALIILYIPAEWIAYIMGRGNTWVIIKASLLGVPTYTSNLSALPMSAVFGSGHEPARRAGLPDRRSDQDAAGYGCSLAPGLKPRFVFISFALAGAIVLGYLKFIIGSVYR